MNPILQETKFNKRAGKETPVLRLYLTRGKDKMMYFRNDRGVYKVCQSPFYFWSMCHLAYPKIQNFYARIIGVAQ